MKRLAIVAAIAGAMFSTPALAYDNVTCNNFSNMAYCSGDINGQYVSYECTDYGYQLDCTMTVPYYYHWTINRY